MGGKLYTDHLLRTACLSLLKRVQHIRHVKTFFVVVLKRGSRMMRNRTSGMCQHNMSHSWWVRLCVFLFTSCCDSEDGVEKGGAEDKYSSLFSSPSLSLHLHHRDTKVRTKVFVGKVVFVPMVSLVRRYLLQMLQWFSKRYYNFLDNFLF